MTAWTNDELTSIGTAEKLQISSARRDGTLMYGRTGGWFPAIQARHQGHIRAGGVVNPRGASRNDQTHTGLRSSLWRLGPIGQSLHGE